MFFTIIALVSFRSDALGILSEADCLREAPPAVAPSPQPSSAIPFTRDPYYVDRDDIMDKVQKLCTRHTRRAALTGLGGVG